MQNSTRDKFSKKGGIKGHMRWTLLGNLIAEQSTFLYPYSYNCDILREGGEGYE